MPHPEQRLEDIHPHWLESFKRDARNLAMSANRSVSECSRLRMETRVDGHGTRLLLPAPQNQAR
jgi:hypothetical protein